MSGTAASGPTEGNASAPGTGFPLDQAISTALAGLSGGGDAPKGDKLGDDIADELTNPEVAALAGKANGKAKDAGDGRNGEDAQASTVGDGSKEKAVGDKADDAKDFEPPHHWTAERKEAFAGLEAPAKDLVKSIARDLEAGFTRKSQELSDKARFAERVSGLFDDRTRAQLRQAGVDEAGAIQYLMRLQSFATDNPTGYIGWAMQSLGVTPQMLVSQMSPAAGQAGADKAPPDPQQQAPGDAKLDDLLADPAVKQLKDQLAEATKRLSYVEGHMSARERAEYEYAQQQAYLHTQSLQGMMQEFRSALDDKTGLAAYPHFDAVAQDMGSLMTSNPTLRQMPDGPEKLKAAYDMAVWARPDMRQGFIDAEATRRAQAAEKKRETERAKRAGAVKPAQGAPTQRPKSSSLDDALLGAFSKLGM